MLVVCETLYSCDDFDALDMDMKKFAVFVQKNVKLRRLVYVPFSLRLSLFHSYG